MQDAYGSALVPALTFSWKQVLRWTALVGQGLSRIGYYGGIQHMFPGQKDCYGSHTRQGVIACRHVDHKHYKLIIITLLAFLFVYSTIEIIQRIYRL